MSKNPQKQTPQQNAGRKTRAKSTSKCPKQVLTNFTRNKVQFLNEFCVQRPTQDHHFNPEQGSITLQPSSPFLGEIKSKRSTKLTGYKILQASRPSNSLNTRSTKMSVRAIL